MSLELVDLNQRTALRFSHLLKFGKSWVDLEQLDAIEFDTVKAPCELLFKSGHAWFLDRTAADALRKYLESNAEWRAAHAAEQDAAIRAAW